MEKNQQHTTHHTHHTHHTPHHTQHTTHNTPHNAQQPPHTTPHTTHNTQHRVGGGLWPVGRDVYCALTTASSSAFRSETSQSIHKLETLKRSSSHIPQPKLHTTHHTPHTTHQVVEEYRRRFDHERKRLAQVSGFGFRVSGSGFGFRDRVSGFGFRIRVSGFGYVDCG